MYDYKAVNELLGEIVAEFGEDYKYKRPGADDAAPTWGVCSYVHKKGETYECGCLIGHLLHRLGMIILEDLYEDRKNTIGIGSFLATWNGGVLYDEFTYGARVLMNIVQENQDMPGATWAWALEKARDTTSLAATDGFNKQ